MVGVEAVQGVGARGAVELNDYVEQVEDVEEQLYERRRWMSDITHEFATAIAQRQSEQIGRLTLVSIISLPVTALTGFFGMNFEWMSTVLASREAFFLLDVLLPVMSVALSMAWLARLGLSGWTAGSIPATPAEGRVDPGHTAPILKSTAAPASRRTSG